MTDPRYTMRWVGRGIALVALLLGWVFIASQNHFHISAPVVFVCIAYLAVVATIYNLWRTGAAAVDDSEEDGDSTWAKPVGALGELEREKRTLLKAIKEAEFDLQMGKLSQRDADEMIQGYRARAIEVIKEIDRLGLGAAGTVREQILREVRARIQLEAKAPRTPGKASGKAEAGTGAKQAKAAAQPAAGKDAATPGAAAKDATASDAAAKDAATKGPAVAGEAKDAAIEAAAHGDAVSRDQPAIAKDAAEAAAKDAPVAAQDAPADGETPAVAPRKPAVVQPRDDELDADSTTALEPRSDDPAKEATR